MSGLRGWIIFAWIALPATNSKEELMIRIAVVALAVTAAAAGIAAYMGSAFGQSNGDAAPIYGIKIPDGYRDWRLISVKRLTGKQLTGAGGELKQLRAELGNDLAIKAYHDGTLPFPDGSIIAALHWNEESSDADNQALAAGFPGLGLESSFAGSAVNAQFMVKDSKKYAASGGWGFADFTKGKPGNEALHEKCFPCHAPAKDRDYVFTRYAPMPGTE
jgi:Cytochrome P460